MFGPWQDQIRHLFGIPAGVGSGDRSQREQQDLIARGATRATNSEHLLPDHALDAPIRMTSAEAQARLDNAGVPGYALYEAGGPNQGTGPHVHFQRDPFRNRSTSTQAASTDWNLDHYRTDLPGGNTVARNRQSEQQGRAILSPAEMASLDTTSATEGTPPSSLTVPAQSPGVVAFTGGRGQNEGSPVLNPFTVGPEVARRAGVIDSELAGQEAFLTQQDATVASIQADRRAHTADYVRQASAVNDTVESGNREMLAQVNPLLARAAAINDQLTHVATMNPLERGIRGLFDLRYNTGYLERTRAQLHAALEDTSSRYQFVTSLQESFLQHLQAGEQLHGVTDALRLTELDENGRLRAQHMSTALASFDALGREITANTQLVQAQSLARGTLLDTMDAPQINSLLANARSHGGQVTVQGIPIPVGELHVRSMNWDKLQTDLQNAHVALQANQASLVEQNARRMVTHMSESQLQTAARNGGVWQGIQLPSDAITQAMGGFTQRRQIEAANAMDAGGGQTAASALHNSFEMMRDTQERFRSVGNTGNNRFEVEQAQTMQEYTRLSTQLTDAFHNGTQDSVAPAIMARLTALRAGFDARIATYAGRLAGGAPITTQVMTAYLRGEPINSDQAAQSMLELVDRGGLPTTMRASPTFRTVYELTERAARMVDAAHGPGSGHEINAQERSRLILNMAHNMRLPAQVNEANMTQLFGATTQIAQQMHHPFGRVDPNDFSRAMQQGNQDGYERIAGDLSTDVATIQALDRGNWTPPAPSNASEAARQQGLRQRFAQMQGQLNSIQQAAFLQHLDESPSARDGFQPSRAYIDLINSNGFLQHVSQFEQMQSNYSFGDAVSSSMGGGNGLVQTAAGYGAHMRSIQTQRTIEQVGGSRRGYGMYSTVPQVRTRVILGAIPGINANDENHLLAFIRQVIPGFDVPNPNANSVIRDGIMNHRFQDPNLERIRQIAAREWDHTAETQDRAMSRLAWQNSVPLVGGAIGNMINGPEGQ